MSKKAATQWDWDENKGGNGFLSQERAFLHWLSGFSPEDKAPSKLRLFGFASVDLPDAKDIAGSLCNRLYGWLDDAMTDPNNKPTRPTEDVRTKAEELVTLAMTSFFVTRWTVVKCVDVDVDEYQRSGKLVVKEVQE